MRGTLVPQVGGLRIRSYLIMDILCSQATQKDNHFSPKYLEWYGLNLDLEHTIQDCRGEIVKSSSKSYNTHHTFV